MELFLKPAPEYRKNQRDRVLRLRWVGEGTIWRRWKFWAVQLIRQTDEPMSCFHIRCFPVCVYMETMPLLFAPHHLCHCCCSCSTPVLGRAPSISTPSRNRRYLNLIYPPPPPPQTSTAHPKSTLVLSLHPALTLSAAVQRTIHIQELHHGQIVHMWPLWDVLSFQDGKEDKIKGFF